MERRAFVAGLSAAVAWTSLARGQQSPVVGFLSTRAAKDSRKITEAFSAGLQDAGFSVGGNVSIEYRFAEGKLDRLPELAGDLVRRPVTLLAAVGGSSSALVAKAATSTIPIVFVMGGDPVGLGLAASLSRPGGNATGMTIISAVLGPKRLGLLNAFVPKATSFAAIVNPDTPEGRAQSADMRTAAQGLGLNLRVLEARTKMRSRRLSRRWQTIGPMRSWSGATRSTMCTATGSLRWSQPSPSRLSINSATSPLPVG
jgi:putative ABC transport system substrate-binding protein